MDSQSSHRHCYSSTALSAFYPNFVALAQNSVYNFGNWLRSVSLPSAVLESIQKKMIAKVAVITVLLALSLRPAESATCMFQILNQEYTCTLQNQNIITENDMMIPGGQHLQGMTNNDVVALVATATSGSTINVFPSLVARRFQNLRRIQLTSVNMREFQSSLTTVIGPTTCGSLLSIDVSNNNITNIPAAMFLGCGQLHTLNFYNNHLDGISAAALTGTNLVELTLSNNHLVVLSQLMLASAPNLEVLRADNNNLMQVTSNNFISVPRLTHLHLHANSLTSWPTDALPNQPNLVELRLDQNMIGNLSANAFLRLPALTTLNLRNNQIRRVEDNTFIDLPAVSNLDLAFNQIDHLKAESIRPITQMRILDVSNNNMSRIDRDLFEGASALQFRATNNLCINQAITIASPADFNNRVVGLLNNCFSFATSVKVNVSILIVTVLLSFLWKM